jgi:hypothetical protein
MTDPVTMHFPAAGLERVMAGAFSPPPGPPA